MKKRQEMINRIMPPKEVDAGAARQHNGLVGRWRMGMNSRRQLLASTVALLAAGKPAQQALANSAPCDPATHLPGGAFPGGESLAQTMTARRAENGASFSARHATAT